MKLNMVNLKPRIINPPFLPDLKVKVGSETLEFYIPNTMFVDPESLGMDFKAFF